MTKIIQLCRPVEVKFSFRVFIQHSHQHITIIIIPILIVKIII